MGWAAIWEQSTKPNKSTYHLRHSYNDRSFPAIKYINRNWYYLYWDNRKYYTRFHSHILTPISLGLGTHQMPLIDALKSAGDSEQTTVVSENLRDATISGEEISNMNLRDNTSWGVPNYKDMLAFGFDDSACLLANIATTTMQEVKTTRELAQEGDTRMYCP